jgi:hypothetical protein
MSREFLWWFVLLLSISFVIDTLVDVLEAIAHNNAGWAVYHGFIAAGWITFIVLLLAKRDEADA